MKNALLSVLLTVLLVSEVAVADVNSGNSIKTASSPPNRVVLLELYTSEGCSSCPPADRFLSGLKSAGLGPELIIPMAFHVTYWDYIGWKDRFASKQFDQRQRTLARKNNLRTIYTPQFVLSGQDYRSYASFSDDVNKLAAQSASVALSLTASILSDEKGSDSMQLDLSAETTKSDGDKLGFYLVVVEDNLSSDVDDGENEGRTLHHDYVVRKFLGPYYQAGKEVRLQRKQTITLQPEWKREDISVVAFAENVETGEVLQAVRLEY